MITGSYSGSIIDIDFNDYNSSEVVRWMIRNTYQISMMEQTVDNVQYYSSSISFEYTLWQDFSIHNFVEFIIDEVNYKFFPQ